MQALGRLRADYVRLLKTIRFLDYAQRLHGAVMDLEDPLKIVLCSSWIPLQRTTRKAQQT